MFEKRFVKKLAFEHAIGVSNSARDLAAKKTLESKICYLLFSSKPSH